MNNNLINSILKLFQIGLIVFYLVFSEGIKLESPILVNLIQAVNYIFIAILVIGRYKEVAYVLTRDCSLILLMIMPLLSFLWSINIFITLRLDLAFIRVSLFGAYLATRYSVREQIRIISWVAGIEVVINLLACLVFPSYGVAYDPNNPSGVLWQGIYTHKQITGRVMGFATTIFIAHLLRKESNHLLALAGVISSIAMVQLSHSSTFLIAVVVSILLIPLYRIAKLHANPRFIILFFVLVILISIGYLVLVNIEIISVSVFGKNAEFNGRTPIWNLAIEYIMQKPWLGYGFGAFWGSELSLELGRQTFLKQNIALGDDLSTAHAHNAFLDIGLQLGLIGLTLLIVNITLVLGRVFKLLNLLKTIEFFWMLEFLAIQLVASSSEFPTYLSPFNFYWIVYVMIACSTARELSRLKRNKATCSQVNLVSSLETL